MVSLQAPVVDLLGKLIVGYEAEGVVGKGQGLQQPAVQGLPDAVGGDDVLGQIVEVDRLDGLRGQIQPAAVGQPHVAAFAVFESLASLTPR